MKSTPLTLDQIEAGRAWVDRIRAQVFAVDPGLDRPESFDAQRLLGVVMDALHAERQVAELCLGLPRAQHPVTYYDAQGQVVNPADLFGGIPQADGDDGSLYNVMLRGGNHLTGRGIQKL